MSAKFPNTAWLLNDGRAGHWRQVEALARYLPVETVSIDVRLKAPWSWAAPRLLPGALSAHRALIPVDSAPPDILVSCGRRSAAAARWIQKSLDPAPRTVQILDCGLNPKTFDWVISPRHDRLRGDNVLHTIGSLNRVDEDWIEQGRNSSHHVPVRQAGLLLGGPSRHFGFSRRWFRVAFERILDQLPSDDSLCVVASPRTPHWAQAMVTSAETHRMIQWVPWTESESSSSGPSYHNVLSNSDILLVTADSVNMVTEACATGCPVYVVGGEKVSGKLARFHSELHQEAYVQWLEPDTTSMPDTDPAKSLRETEDVARQLVQRGVLG